MPEVKAFLIDVQKTVRQAMQQMNELGEKELFVVKDGGRLAGSLSDGDIRKWILKGGHLESPVDRICNKSPQVVKRGYDLDHVKNGICLCKLHHWAFDDGLIAITFDGSNYVVRIPHESEDDMLDRPEFSIDYLRRFVGVIPAERFPENQNLWPSPELLERLRAILS